MALYTAAVHITGPKGEKVEYSLESSSINGLKHKLTLLGYEDMLGENAENMKQWRADNNLKPVKAKK